MKWSDLRIRIIILVIIGVLSLGALIFVYQGPVWPVNTGRSFPPVGVSFFWERDAVNVRVDDREERVPRDQVATSTLYQQAIDRLPSDARIGGTEVRWNRVFRYWSPLMILTWWILFRVWLPRNAYLEGAPVS